MAPGRRRGPRSPRCSAKLTNRSHLQVSQRISSRALDAAGLRMLWSCRTECALVSKQVHWQHCMLTRDQQSMSSVGVTAPVSRCALEKLDGRSGATSRPCKHCNVLRNCAAGSGRTRSFSLKYTRATRVHAQEFTCRGKLCWLAPRSPLRQLPAFYRIAAFAQTTPIAHALQQFRAH